MKGSFLILKGQIFISILIQVAGYDRDKEDGNAFDPSQGISQGLRTEGIYDDRTADKNLTSTIKDAGISSADIDPNGYILYCPCMGRFGNQADQFLGSLAFAKGLNRTLALPPWIVYPSFQPGSSLQVTFKKWFKVKPLLKYHRVIPMEDFMTKVATRIWPPGQRTGFCYTFRGLKTCAMKDGNPFGPFWDHFKVDFDGYEEHTGLLWNAYVPSEQQEWLRRYPPSKFPVLAFQGAPGEFPSIEIHQPLQKYLKFSKYINKKADQFIKDILEGRPYLAIHLRNGPDMINVCSDVGSFTSLFGSAQCFGYNSKKKLTQGVCLPSKKEIIRKVTRYTADRNLKAVFVATDEDPMLHELREALDGQGVSVNRRTPEDETHDPVVDLAIMAKADLFIGNCISTFSAFVRRHRDANRQETKFFGID